MSSVLTPLVVRRMIEPESVFGDIKDNRGFKRFLKGFPEVSQSGDLAAFTSP